MRYSRNQLLKLRSGQGVWRVLFYISGEGKLVGEVGRRIVKGKKILYWFRDTETNKPIRSSVMMDCKAEKGNVRYSPNFEHLAHFLSDLMGDGAFSKRSQAERYVAEVLAGIHPDVEERIRWHDRIDRDLSNMLDTYLEDEYYDDFPIDEGDEGLRELDDDPLWNESNGHGD